MRIAHRGFCLARAGYGGIVDRIVRKKEAMKLRRPHAVAALAALLVLGATACSPKEVVEDPAPSGSSSVDAPPAPVGDPREAVDAALAGSIKQTSYTMSITAPEADINISIDYTTQSMVMTVDGKVGGDGVKGEIRVVDGKGYLNFADTSGGGVDTGGKWLAMPPEDVAEDDPFVVIKTVFDGKDLLEAGAEVTVESPGVYKITPGDSTFHMSEFLGEMTNPGTGAFKATELRLSVGADNLVSTMEFSDAKGAKIVISMSDYGTPVKVDKPADSEIMGG